MNTILESVLEKQRVMTPEGKEEPLHSAIDEKEVAFVTSLVSDFKCKRSLEVGCAMGVSALAICEAIVKNDSAAVHTIIDPYQSTDWKNIGIYQLQRAGYKNNYRLIEKPSEFALPQLVQEAYKFDFAFIDGWHTFDHTMIDFFYINRLLRNGGILVVDDVQMPSVNKVMRMIHTYPAYRLIGSVDIPDSKRRRLIQGILTAIRPLTLLTGKRLAPEIWSAGILSSNKKLGLNSSVVAFQKMAEDDRPWNWYEHF